ncbi:MAG TPA: DUF1801 domain-containing protein [Caulobacterales bacterium]|nr:DUF1801 domain-containing protein [Caulobacterales bacterium]
MAKQTRSKPAPKAKSAKSVAARSADWRAETLARVRAIIEEADPQAVEERKWKKASNPAGVPVWSHEGMICTGETYKTHVKLTFASGAALKDPARLFNASLDGGARRPIDFHEGDEINAKALKALIQAAVALNQEKAMARSAKKSKRA